MHNNKGQHAAAVLIGAGVAISTAPESSAQEVESTRIEEIVVVGTRRQGRTVADSPVPVDVFQGSELRNIGTGDIDEVLRTLIPSYNVQIESLSDEGSLNRPAALRSLPPDNTLVLLNGKRLHRSGVVSINTGGSQGPDLSIIPATAVQQVEVLRDGASAQYGSDAIAGVINFITRDSDDGITLELETGQYFEGDGEANQISTNVGLPVADMGFLNLSLEIGNRDTMARAIQTPDAALLQSFGATGIPNPAQPWGQPEISDEVKFFANSAITVNDTAELYGFLNYAQRNVEIIFFYRNPNAQGGIYSIGPPGDVQRLVFDLTGDGSGNCAQAGTPNALPAPDQFFATQAEYDADQIALALLATDPNCWTVNEVYPSGYRPVFGADIHDWTAAGGYRGESANGLRYDISATYGTNVAEYQIRNTINASLGPSSPTSFSPGESVQEETAVNIDLVWPVDVTAFSSALNIAGGFEWRDESYETKAGDEASWIAGPLHLQGANIGSHGYAGYSPDQAGKWQRSNIAFYLDLEADITEKFLLGLAGRYEDFKDFGSTSNYKASFRYAFSDAIAVRGSASTGFRAPTPGQANIIRLSTRGSILGLVQIGLIPPTNPIAVFYGGKALEPEESENLSVGIAVEPLDNLTVTLDAYRIDVENQVNIGDNIELTPEDIADLIAQGVPNASDFEQIEFFVNSEESRVTGFDLVATYAFGWQSSGSTELSVAWNNTKSELTSSDFPSREATINQENQPRDRFIITGNHYWNDWRFLLRASYYDGWIEADFFGEDEPTCSDERPIPFGADLCYGDIWTLDAEVAYTFSEHFTVVAGADNILDEYPDINGLFPDFSGGRIYPGSSPIGYGGGFWYLRLRAEF